MRRALSRAERVLARHGGAMVFMARLIPGLRVVGALVAGAALMEWPRFLRFNLAGAIVWALITAGLGYALGRQTTWLRTLTGHPWLAALAAVAFFTLLLLAQYAAARRLDRPPNPQ